MKILYLNRHAKSSWSNPLLSDHDRPLNKRGERDAPFMGSVLRKKGILPDLIVSSPANRAYTTACIIAEKLGYPVGDIQKNKDLYFSGTSGMIDVIRSVADDVDSLMLFGHNPDFTATAEYLTGDYIENIPTCGNYCIQFNISSWKEIGEGNGKKVFFEYPKLYFK